MLEKLKKNNIVRRHIAICMLSLLLILPICQMTALAVEPQPSETDASSQAYDSWLDGWATGDTYDGSNSAFLEDEEDTTKTGGVFGWLEEALEAAISLLLRFTAGGLLSKMSDDFDMTVESVVYGRVGTGGNNFYQFGLEDGNIYGAVGSILYALLRNVIFALFAIQFVYMLGSYLLKGTGKGRADLKGTLYNFLLMFAMLYAMPIIVDIILFVRDAILKLFVTMTAQVTGSYKIGITDQVMVMCSEDLSIASTLILLCMLGCGIYFAASYLRIALQELYLFGVFPVVAYRSFSDRQIFNKWVGHFVTALFVPVLDAVGLWLVVLVQSMGSSGSEPHSGPIMLALIVYMAIIPCRNAICQLFGMPVPGRGFNLAAAAMLMMRMLGPGKKEEKGTKEEDKNKPAESREGGKALTDGNEKHGDDRQSWKNEEMPRQEKGVANEEKQELYDDTPEGDMENEPKESIESTDETRTSEIETTESFREENDLYGTADGTHISGEGVPDTGEEMPDDLIRGEDTSYNTQHTKQTDTALLSEDERLDAALDAYLSEDMGNSDEGEVPAKEDFSAPPAVAASDGLGGSAYTKTLEEKAPEGNEGVYSDITKVSADRQISDSESMQSEGGQMVSGDMKEPDLPMPESGGEDLSIPEGGGAEAIPSESGKLDRPSPDRKEESMINDVAVAGGSNQEMIEDQSDNAALSEGVIETGKMQKSPEAGTAPITEKPDIQQKESLSDKSPTVSDDAGKSRIREKIDQAKKAIVQSSPAQSLRDNYVGVIRQNENGRPDLKAELAAVKRDFSRIKASAPAKAALMATSAGVGFGITAASGDMGATAMATMGGAKLGNSISGSTSVKPEEKKETPKRVKAEPPKRAKSPAKKEITNKSQRKEAADLKKKATKDYDSLGNKKQSANAKANAAARKAAKETKEKAVEGYDAMGDKKKPEE